MSLSGDKGVAQFKKSVKMGHPNQQHNISFGSTNKYTADIVAIFCVKRLKFEKKLLIE